jgi:phenylacetate-CoA ligase
MSSQAQRDVWSESWGVPVLDEFCSEEVSTIMFHQCPRKKYHINSDNCVLESVNDDGQPVSSTTEGNLVVTALWNYAMPLIRYNQGDRVVLDEPHSTCSCGSQLPLLSAFEGRSNDAFILRSGRVLSSGYLLDVGYSALVKYSDMIKYWSLIQEDVDRVVLECSLKSGTCPSVLDNIKDDVSSLFFGEAKAEIRVVDTPLEAKKGKRKQIRTMVTK